IDELTIADNRAFVQYVEGHMVTHIDSTPSFLNQLEIPDDTSLRRIVAGGEVLTSAIAEKLMAKTQVYNTYGPTETTVTTTVHKVIESDLSRDLGVPIGKPIGNAHLLVLGNHGQQQPFDVPGRLHIGGAGVSLGYVDRPELTKQRFIKHPLMRDSIVYDTGDIVSLSPDGLLMYLSRSDQQVKLRGFRIELGEIESAMMRIGAIERAVVTLYRNDGESALVAYYVSAQRFSTEQIREQLIDHLPVYMIPSMVIKVDKIPLNSNGKADIKALPAPFIERGEVTLPENETEVVLVGLWSEVLKLNTEDISTTRSFFDLGGHSLRVAQLKHEISNKLEYDISIVQLFHYQTVREQAALIAQKGIGLSQRYDDSLMIPLNDIKVGVENIFFIHDGSGDIFGYKKLAIALKEYNCWGIRSATMSHSGPVAATVQQLAQRYIRMIRKLQPEGAFSLVGWSLGGSIAYEVTRQMEADNMPLNRLFMIDTDFFCESFKESGQSQEFGYTEELRVVQSIGLALSAAEIAVANDTEKLWMRLTDQLRDSQTLLTQFKRFLPQDVKALLPFLDEYKADELVRLFNTIRSLTYAVSTHEIAGQITTPTIYLKADQSDINLSGLQEFFEQQVTVITLKASHFNILKQPQLQHTVAEMRKYLTRPETIVLQDEIDK
ncbi:MAG: thioesterase domain-containing protein, partial [Bacteroidota bacterium]